MYKACLFAIMAFLLVTTVVFYPHDTQGQQVENNCIVVYYFHGSFRCPTCLMIERYSKEAVENSFKNELISGKITFKAINIEEKGNEHFVNDYQLYTRSLVICLKKDGKEIKYKNLTKVWDYIMDKKLFFDYVKNEVASLLKER